MRPVQQIITAYLAAGGAKMDEPSYQKYKHTMMLDWLIRERVFETVNKQNSRGDWITHSKENEPNYICKSALDCEFTTTEIECAMDHLVKHFPEYFMDQNLKEQASKGATNGSNKS